MTDLIERLRDGTTVPLMEERNAAANELERLTAELAALKQGEPVAYRWPQPRLHGVEWRYSLTKTRGDSQPLYAAPPTPATFAQGYAEGFNDACKPAPAAVPLTDDEMMVAFRATHGLLQLIEAYVAGVAFAERHHGIAAGDKPVPARLRAGAD